MSVTRTGPHTMHRLALTLGVILLLGSSAFAQETPAARPPTPTSAATDQARTSVPHASTPREALTAFLRAGSYGDFELAAAYLDLGEVPEAERQPDGPRLARRLYLLLLRKAWVEPATVSNDPAGTAGEDRPAGTERLTTIQLRSETVDLELQRKSIAGSQAWLFSQRTVALVDALYGTHGYGWIGDHLPAVFFTVTFAGLQLWQWLTLALILSLGWVISRVVGHVIVVVLAGMAKRTASTLDDEMVRAVDGPLGFFLWGLSLAVTSPWVGLAPETQKLVQVGWRLLALIGVGWLMFRAWDQLTRHLRERSGQLDQVLVGYIPLIAKLGRVMVALIILLGALDVVGINVVGLLAGLGLGGLALAFAAQKTLENLFGALAIASDGPFKVGDYVTAAGVTGTVEAVGLRSTRIRTLDRTLVTIPNGSIVADAIVNFAPRDRFLFNPTIGVIYGTSVAQLTWITDEIRRLLLTHPKVWQEAHRVRFKGFGASSLDIEVFSWLLAEDYNAFTAVAEELNFRIAEIVQASGSGFAFPSRTVYMAKDGGMDQERAAATEEQVAERRAAGELAVPEPSDELRERLRPAPAPES